MKRKKVVSGADKNTNKVKFATAREDMKRKTVRETGTKADGMNLNQNIKKKMSNKSKNGNKVVKGPRKV